MHRLVLERAFYCGIRYAWCYRRRRPPPRMRTGRPGAPDYWRFHEQQMAFYAGYDAYDRALRAHKRTWSEPWSAPELESCRTAAQPVAGGGLT